MIFTHRVDINPRISRLIFTHPLVIDIWFPPPASIAYGPFFVAHGFLPTRIVHNFVNKFLWLPRICDTGFSKNFNTLYFFYSNLFCIRGVAATFF